MGRAETKKRLICECGRAVTMKPVTIYCPSCGHKMRELGYRFFDHVKIVNLHRSENRPDERYYLFNLSLGGIIVNGFTYNADKHSLMMPKGFDRKTRVVKTFGKVVRRIREILDKEIEELESGKHVEIEERAA